VAYGASEEIGPFRINRTGSSLYMNKYSWNRGNENKNKKLSRNNLFIFPFLEKTTSYVPTLFTLLKFSLKFF
jgi:hypothetical protein